MSNTKNLFESIQTSLNEEAENEFSEVNDMSIEEMIKEYADMCDDAGLETIDILENLVKYDCLQTGSFRNMLEELNEYLES